MGRAKHPGWRAVGGGDYRGRVREEVRVWGGRDGAGERGGGLWEMRIHQGQRGSRRGVSQAVLLRAAVGWGVEGRAKEGGWGW